MITSIAIAIAIAIVADAGAGAGGRLGQPAASAGGAVMPRRTVDDARRHHTPSAD